MGVLWFFGFGFVLGLGFCWLFFVSGCAFGVCCLGLVGFMCVRDLWSRWVGVMWFCGFGVGGFEWRTCLVGICVLVGFVGGVVLVEMVLGFVLGGVVWVMWFWVVVTCCCVCFGVLLFGGLNVLCCLSFSFGFWMVCIVGLVFCVCVGFVCLDIVLLGLEFELVVCWVVWVRRLLVGVGGLVVLLFCFGGICFLSVFL